MSGPVLQRVSPQMERQQFQFQKLDQTNLALVHDGAVATGANARNAFRFAVALLDVRLEQTIVQERLPADVTLRLGRGTLGGNQQVRRIQVYHYRFVLVLVLNATCFVLVQRVRSGS